MEEHPHVPAAFINALEEEGTRHELVHFLQKTWNMSCAYAKRIRELQAENDKLRNIMKSVIETDQLAGIRSTVHDIARAALQCKEGDE